MNEINKHARLLDIYGLIYSSTRYYYVLNPDQLFDIVLVVGRFRDFQNLTFHFLVLSDKKNIHFFHIYWTTVIYYDNIESGFMLTNQL